MQNFTLKIPRSKLSWKIKRILFSQKYIIKNIIVQVVMSKFYDKLFFLDSLSGWEGKCFVQGSMTIVCFYLGGDFSGHLFSPSRKGAMERSKKVDGGKTFWRLNGEEVLYGLRESQSVILKTRSVFCDENWIKFFYMNNYEFLWKATVFTKNTLQTRTEIFHCFDTFQQH